MDSRLRRLADALFAQSDSAAINPAAIGADLLPHMFLLDVERAAPDGPPKLRIRLTGTALDQIFARPLVGCLLETFVHGPRGDQVLAGFHHCADTHEPLWMRQVVQIKDKAPRFVEGIAIFLAPERICGGLVTGEASEEGAIDAFVREALVRSA